MSAAQQRMSFVLGAVVVILGIVRMGVHTVHEGNVAVYWRAGRLLNEYGEAGVHVMLPFIDRMEEVQITLQTDRVSNIPCGTSGGVIVEFKTIEVVNRLSKEHAIDIIRNYGVDYDKTWIFDKIHHEINQFCSSHTLQEVYIDLFSTLDESLVVALQADIDKHAKGINIIAVRVTKPIIPASILRTYEKMEEEKTQLLVSVQKANVERQQAETEKMKAEIAAQQQASVSKIDTERFVNERLADKRVKEIEDEIYLSHQKALSDAEFYNSQQQAEANKLMYTPEYLKFTFAKALMTNSKIYFGEKLPTTIIGQLDEVK